MRKGARGPRRKILGTVEIEYNGRWREREVLECGHLHLVGLGADEHTISGTRYCRGCLQDRQPEWDLDEWEPIEREKSDA